ncbi:MAG: NUDIX domain-containing protein [Microbacterium sp.]
MTAPEPPEPQPEAQAPGPEASARREVHVSAAVISHADHRLLLVRKTGTTAFMQPGGKPEPGETPAETLIRELAEELGLTLSQTDLAPLGRFTADAANEPGYQVIADVFRVDIGAQTPVPDAEIAELRWITRAEASALEVAPLARAYFLPEA